MFSTPNWLDHKLSTLSPAHPTQPPQSQLESENAHQCTHHALLPNTSPPPLHPASRLPLDKHCHHKPAEARPGGLGSIALQTTAHTLPYSQLIGLSEASSGCIVYVIWGLVLFDFSWKCTATPHQCQATRFEFEITSSGRKVLRWSRGPKEEWGLCIYESCVCVVLIYILYTVYMCMHIH